MKIKATRENLLFGVSAVQKAVSTKSTLPILNCIKIEALGEYLYFSATDLDIGIQCQVPIETIEEGATIVPAKYFSEIVRKLPDTNIALELINENELIIQYENSQLNFKALPIDDFPKIPEDKGEYKLAVSGSLVKQMVKQVVFACGTDETRPLFTGVLCEFEGNNFRMISTDTHRLALKQGNINNDSEKLISFIVPAKILSELARLIQQEDETCYININKNLVTFIIVNIRIVCRLLEGQFPNYRQVIPSQYNLKTKIKTKLLQEAVERISLFSVNSNSNTIQIKIQNNLMTIYSQSELGKGYEQINIESDGEPVDIAFNYRYLLDVFRVLEDEYLSIEFTGSLSPGIIRSAENNNFLYLVLPVRS